MRNRLTLPPPGFQSIYILWGIAILSFVALEIIARLPDRNIGALMLCLLGIIIAGGFGINQTESVIQQRYFRKPLEYDEHNLYIKQKDGSETTIPFTDISEISYSFLTQRTYRSRGNFVIHYRINDNERKVLLTVFKATRPTFKQFAQRVLTDNPSLSFDNWAIGLPSQ